MKRIMNWGLADEMRFDELKDHLVATNNWDDFVLLGGQYTVKCGFSITTSARRLPWHFSRFIPKMKLPMIIEHRPQCDSHDSGPDF
jgi:hypothetical protein